MQGEGWRHDLKISNGETYACERIAKFKAKHLIESL